METKVSTGVMSAHTILRRGAGALSLKSLPKACSAALKPHWGGCCQSNANPSPLIAAQQVLGDEEVAPLVKGGVAFLFEADSRVDVPFQIEVIVH